MIPFVDLKAQYHSIKPEIDAAIQVIVAKAALLWREISVLRQHVQKRSSSV